MNICILVFAQICVFFSWLNIWEVNGWIIWEVCNFLSNCKHFQNECTILHSYQLCIKVSVSPYPHQQLIGSINLTFFNIWNMTIKFCFNDIVCYNIYVRSWLVLIHWLFYSLVVIFSCFFAYLVIFDWMPDTVSFPLLDAGYFIFL